MEDNVVITIKLVLTSTQYCELSDWENMTQFLTMQAYKEIYSKLKEYTNEFISDKCPNCGNAYNKHSEKCKIYMPMAD